MTDAAQAWKNERIIDSLNRSLFEAERHIDDLEGQLDRARNIAAALESETAGCTCEVST